MIYAFGAMLSFTMAHAAVIRLRITQPDHERPWKGPGKIRVRGGELPLFAVFGGWARASRWWSRPPWTRASWWRGCCGWPAASPCTSLYRRRQELPLTETRKVVLPQPAVEHEVEYESVLVAFEDSHYSAEAVNTAAKLAAHRRRGIHVLVTITVPANAPIDAPLEEQEARRR